MLFYIFLTFFLLKKKKKKKLQSFIDKGGEWLHIDMAGPSSDAERSTAYGVALMYSLVKTIDGQDK